MAKKYLIMLVSLISVFALLIFFKSANGSSDQVEKRTDNHAVKKELTEEEKQLKSLPDVTSKDWQLLLVNGENPFKEKVGELSALKNGYLVDKRIYKAYTDLEEAAKKADFDLVVVSAYRSVEDQKTVFQDSVNTYLNQGLSEEEAKEKTESYMAVPGTSEHHTGLALDVVDQPWYQAGKGLEEEFSATPAGKWLKENVATYGFIVRYPVSKEKITGINYEPWHLRYVGKESAQYMQKNNLALEEYITLLKKAEK